ncbi:hypothetical protein IWQ61_008604 [Dispira simplex]|nr:hypothetical protein IWQ61_008604 [Dispira simplex]
MKEWIQKVRVCQQDLKNQLNTIDRAEFSGLNLEWESIREAPVETIPSKDVPEGDGQPLVDQAFYSSSDDGNLISPAPLPQRRLSNTHTSAPQLTALGDTIDDSFFDDVSVGDVDVVVQTVHPDPTLPSSTGDETEPHPMVTLDEDFETSPEEVLYSPPPFLGKSTRDDMGRSQKPSVSLPFIQYRTNVAPRNLVSTSKIDQAQGLPSTASEPASSQKPNSLPNSLPVTPDEELHQHNPWSLGTS